LHGSTAPRLHGADGQRTRKSCAGKWPLHAICAHIDVGEQSVHSGDDSPRALSSSFQKYSSRIQSQARGRRRTVVLLHPPRPPPEQRCRRLSISSHPATYLSSALLSFACSLQLLLVAGSIHLSLTSARCIFPLPHLAPSEATTLFPLTRT
ncbi:hypothetical protein PMIN02_002580, partial [Paraphaeosphaeria minitans]